MQLVDSNKEELDTSTIIARSVGEAKEAGQLPKNVTLQAAILSIVAEGSMPNTKVEQIGNTVFMSHYSEDSKEVAMRAFNADTARNYLENSVKYVKALPEQGVERMTSDFSDKKILQLFNAIARRPELQEWGMQVYKLNTGDMRAYVVLKGA
jgi:hypothetical protein